jgi:hypothetical protein
MKRRLYIIAAITSPIISLYGSSPFYIFDKVTLLEFLTLNFGLSASIFISWLIQIYTLEKYPLFNHFWRFIVTYVFSLFFRLVIFLVSKLLDIPIPPINIEDTHIAYPIITSFAVNAIIMVIADSIVKSFKKNEAEKLVQELKLQNSEAQKQILMQQLQPHFLFNSLSVLKSLIKENPDDAEDYTIKLSEFLRYSVEAHKQEIISLEKELAFVKDYIELQKVRFDNAFHYEITIPKEALEYKVPVFALQTLIENIFKHNYFTEKNPIHFSISVQNDILMVANQKVSIKLTEKTFTGLQNLKQRCELISGKSIEIIDSENSFSVSIYLIKP